MYTLPTEPSALRVGVWRKLKRTGALLHHDALWILPANPRTREQFQWLAAEIVELGGQVSLWEAGLVMGMDAEALVLRFQEQVEAGYRSLLKQVEEGKEDIETIARRYQHWLSRDYFHSALGQRVRRMILEARGSQA